MIRNQKFGALLADKAFDVQWLIERLQAQGVQIVISQRPNRCQPLFIDEHMYRWRHLIENFLGKLKEFKRWIEERIRGSFALSFQKALAKKRRGQKAPRTGLRSTPLFHSPTMALACLRSASSSVTPCSAAALGLSMSWAAPVALAMAPGCSPLRMRSAMRPAWRPIS